MNADNHYLFVWPVNRHALTKLHHICAQHGWATTSIEGGFMVDLPAPETSATILQTLAEALTREEADNTRILLTDQPSLQIADVPRIQTLRQAVARIRTQWLQSMLTDNRLTSVFQPIVRVDAPAEIAGYEALLRGLAADGSIISPGTLLASARESGLLPALDAAGRLCAIREAQQHHLTGALFINFTPTAIYDPAACLRTTIHAVEAAALDPARVVFEVIEAEELDDLDHVRHVLDVYRRRGFRVALDDIGSGYAGLSWLSALYPDFLKLDRQLVQGVAEDPFKATVLAKVIELGKTLGITVIAEGVERLEDFFWLRAHGADLVQGFLFARPASPPPEVDPMVLQLLT